MQNAPFDRNIAVFAIPGEIFGWRDITIGVGSEYSGDKVDEFQWKWGGWPPIGSFVRTPCQCHGPVHTRKNQQV